MFPGLGIIEIMLDWGMGAPRRCVVAKVPSLQPEDDSVRTKHGH